MLLSLANSRACFARQPRPRADWHPILDWSLDDVFAFLRERKHPLHEAYTVYGSSRVSCAFCVLAARGDLAAAARCADNAAVYRALVDLEAESTFAFQQHHWLADAAPMLLDEKTRCAVGAAKQRAQEREEAEARIPQDLLYEAGWPRRCPTWPEACLLAEVRRTVCTSLGLEETFTTAEAILTRYRELLAAKAQKG